MVVCSALLAAGLIWYFKPDPSPAPVASKWEHLRKRSGGYVRGPGAKKVIVFVNGLFGDALSTWSAGNNYWPEMMTEDPDLKDTDIYVYSFDSPRISSAQNISELAGRM